MDEDLDDITELPERTHEKRLAEFPARTCKKCNREIPAGSCYCLCVKDSTREAYRRYLDGHARSGNEGRLGNRSGSYRDNDFIAKRQSRSW